MGIINRIFGKKKKEILSKESPENSLRSEFLKAINNNKVENVKTALEAGADPNCIIENEFKSYPEGYPHHRGEVPLMAAAYMGNAEIVDLLLDAGVDPNYRDSYGRDALINAALCLDRQDQLPVIERLLKRGADPNHKENNNVQSAIQLAAYFGHIEAVKMILNSGLITETFNLKKALNCSEDKGNQEICDLVKNYIEKVKSEEESLITKTTTDTNEGTTSEKTIYFGEMMTGRTVDVTISVEGFIHGSDLYGGKYHAKLPVNMVSDQLLNHIADKIGVIASFHMGYMLLLNGETILTCREKKTLGDTDVKDGDILTFIDWG